MAVHQPKVDEWYEHNGTIARVAHVRSDDVSCDMSNGGRWEIGDRDSGHEFTQVRVVPMKPKRKLKLSEGIAWLQTWQAGRYMLCSSSSGKKWCVWDSEESAFLVFGCETPINALIAARKAVPGST